MVHASQDTQIARDISSPPSFTPPSPSQAFDYPSDVARLFLIGRSVLLDYWPAEELIVKDGRASSKSFKSVLNGSLVRLASTKQLAQISNGAWDPRGHRVLKLQGVKDTSVHDIMENPWPNGKESIQVFEQLLEDAKSTGRLRSLTVIKVATMLHRLEQASYWGTLKNTHDSSALTPRGKIAVQEQMAACLKSMQAAPSPELVSMVQAGCEEEEPGEVSEGRRALRAYLRNSKAAPRAAAQTSKPQPAPAKPDSSQHAKSDIAAGSTVNDKMHQRAKSSTVTGNGVNSNADQRARSNSATQNGGSVSSEQGAKPILHSTNGDNGSFCLRKKSNAPLKIGVNGSADAPSQPNFTSIDAEISALKAATAKAEARQAHQAQQANAQGSNKRPRTAASSAPVGPSNGQVKNLRPASAQPAVQPMQKNSSRRAQSALPLPAMPNPCIPPEFDTSLDRVSRRLLETCNSRSKVRAAQDLLSGIHVRQGVSVSDQSVRTAYAQSIEPNPPRHAPLFMPETRENSDSIITSATIARLATSKAGPLPEKALPEEGSEQARGQSSVLVRPPSATRKRKSPEETSDHVQQPAQQRPAASTAPASNPSDPKSAPQPPGSKHSLSPSAVGTRKQIKWDPKTVAAASAAAKRLAINASAWQKDADKGSTHAALASQPTSAAPAVKGAGGKPSAAAPKAGFHAKAGSSAAPGETATSASAGKSQSGKDKSQQSQKQPNGSNNRQPGDKGLPADDRDPQKAELDEQRKYAVSSGHLKWSWGNLESPVTGQLHVSLVDVMLKRTSMPATKSGSFGSGAGDTQQLLWLSDPLDPSTPKGSAPDACCRVFLVHCTGTPALVKGKANVASTLSSNSRAFSPADANPDTLKQFMEHWQLWSCLHHSGAALWTPVGDATHASSADATDGSQHGACLSKADRPDHTGQPASKEQKSEMEAEAPANSLSGQAAVTDADVTMAEIPPLTGVLSANDEPGCNAQLGVAKHNTVIKQEDSKSGGSYGARSRILMVAGSHLKTWMSNFETEDETGKAVEKLGDGFSNALFLLLVQQKHKGTQQSAAAGDGQANHHRISRFLAHVLMSRQQAQQQPLQATEAAAAKPSSVAATAEAQAASVSKVPLAADAVSQQPSQDTDSSSNSDETGSDRSDGVVRVTVRQPKAASSEAPQLSSKVVPTSLDKPAVAGKEAGQAGTAGKQVTTGSVDSKAAASQQQLASILSEEGTAAMQGQADKLKGHQPSETAAQTAAVTDSDRGTGLQAVAGADSLQPDLNMPTAAVANAAGTSAAHDSTHTKLPTATSALPEGSAETAQAPSRQTLAASSLADFAHSRTFAQQQQQGVGALGHNPLDVAAASSSAPASTTLDVFNYDTKPKLARRHAAALATHKALQALHTPAQAPEESSATASAKSAASADPGSAQNPAAEPEPVPMPKSESQTTAAETESKAAHANAHQPMTTAKGGSDLQTASDAAATAAHHTAAKDELDLPASDAAAMGTQAAARGGSDLQAAEDTAAANAVATDTAATDAKATDAIAVNAVATDAVDTDTAATDAVATDAAASDAATAAAEFVQGLTQSRPKQKRQHRQSSAEERDNPDRKRAKAEPETSQQAEGTAQKQAEGTAHKPAPQQAKDKSVAQDESKAQDRSRAPDIPRAQDKSATQGKSAAPDKAAAAHQSKVRELISHPGKAAAQKHSSAHRQQIQYVQSFELPHCTIDSIFRSMRRLHLVGHGQHGKEVLSQEHLSRTKFKQMPPLDQLRCLSKYASEVKPHGNVIKFFQGVVANVSSKHKDTRWLAERDETPTSYRLGAAARTLYERLGDLDMLAQGAVPAKVPQLLPLPLQAAYVLCLGGYIAKQSLPAFADDLLRCILAQVVLAMERNHTVAKWKQTARLNLELAGGSADQVLGITAAGPSSSQARDSSSMRDTKSQGAPASAPSVKLYIDDITRAVVRGMVLSNRLRDGTLDHVSRNFLQKLQPVWRLKALSMFSQRQTASSNASAFLTTVCKHTVDQANAENYSWLRQTGKPSLRSDPNLNSQARVLLDQAFEKGILAKHNVDSAVIAALPLELHSAAVCYMIGARGSDLRSGDGLSAFAAYVWDIVQEVDPEADPTRRDRSRPPSLLRSASQQPHDVYASSASFRSDAHQSAAAEYDGNPNLVPPGRRDPRQQPPSQSPDPQGRPRSFPNSHQQPSQHQSQSHGPRRPRHCQFFYRVEGGCRNNNCNFYHGTHQEYVEAMAQTGLVPYGLKFRTTTGRDRWIVDMAVDALNKLMIERRLPRGSFTDCDLRPLGFLEEPSGEHSKLQLQAVQAIAEHGPTFDPAQLLQDVCNQVQAAQQGYGRDQEGYAGGAAGYRGVSVPPGPDLAPMPQVAMSEPPFASAPMFSGHPDFTPSPVGQPMALPFSQDALPFSQDPLPFRSEPLPFRPDPLPTIEPSQDDIPFPLLLYEEVLLAGLLQLQQMTGAVDSVDHLLAMQPHCIMPPEIAKHFSGDTREQVLGLLHNRPWLFGVSPHGSILVTGLAREGLVYKRDVITHLYNAFTDGTPSVLVAELDEQVAQPPGIRQVIMESNSGLAELLQSPLFKEDVIVHFGGPFGPCAWLRMSGS